MSPRGDFSKQSIDDKVQNQTQSEIPVVQKYSPVNNEKQATNQEETDHPLDDETATMNLETRRSVRIRKAPERLDL